MFCMKLLERTMECPTPELRSTRSTSLCHFGNDLSHWPAPLEEFSTRYLTLAAFAASIALLSSSTSCGTGEHTRKSESTPAKARRRDSRSPKSAITVRARVGALRASASDRYIAVTGDLVSSTLFNTAPLTFPDAPVTRIIAIHLRCNQMYSSIENTAGIFVLDIR